jgi:hypothetical protein
MLDDGAKLALVPASAELIENHACDVDVPVEGLIAEYQRRHAACHAARIDHQHDGNVQQLRQCGIAVAAIEVKAVIQALVPFHQRHIGIGGLLFKDIGHFFVTHEIEIKIVAGTSARSCEPHGVDIVRSLFVGLNLEAPLPQRGAQTDAQGGLP